MTITRIVFEKGIEISHGEDGVWVFASSPTKQSIAAPKDVTAKYGVRPVLYLSRLLGGGDRMGSFLYPINAPRVLELERIELADMAHTKDMPTLFHTVNLAYVVGAVFHHCRKLAEEYSEICRAFVSSPHPKTVNSETFNLSSSADPYYEFDALVTAALRMYNATRYIIWRVFGPKKASTPRSFQNTLRACDGIPASLEEQLRLSWSQYGNRIQNYRDCILHNVPIGGLIHYARMDRLEGGVWSTTLRIPDNPETKSQDKFEYEEKIDALTYGWEVTNEVIEIAQAIVEAVPDRESTQ